MNKDKNKVNYEDKETSTIQSMTDIVRIDLSIEINEFSNHIQSKIERLDERMRFVNYKFEDVRVWFKRYSISIIYLATLLTLIEALINSFDNCEVTDVVFKNILHFIPLLISSLVSLIAAIIKFNKYEEKIEDITRATEKCIITIAKLKEVKEELYFCKTVDEFLKINDRFTRDIYTEYLESNTNIERQLIDTDYAKYMKKVAHNDVERAKILIQRNRQLDDLEKLDDSDNETATLIDKEEDDENLIKNNVIKHNLIKNNLTNSSKEINISSEHNCKKRPIPYRGTSPPPARANISNKKMTTKKCKRCERNYLVDVNSKDKVCPYCKTIEEEVVELIIDKNINKVEVKKNKAEHVNYIQKIWRGRQARKKLENPRDF